MQNSNWFIVSTKDEELHEWLRTISPRAIYAREIKVDGFGTARTYVPAYYLNGEQQITTKLKAKSEVSFMTVNSEELVESHEVIERLQDPTLHASGGWGPSLALQQAINSQMLGQQQAFDQRARTNGLINGFGLG